MSKIGLHKQWTNRPLEWQQNIKVVVSSTEWDNFFKLRLDSETVQPEFVQLAKMMKDAKDSSVPQELPPGAWHLPYVRTYIGPVTGKILYYVDGVDVCLESAKKISVAACAQVSYRTLDLSLEKAGKIIKMLTKSDDPHLSPFEHLATPMMETQYPDNDDWDFDGYNVPYQTETWQEGITHADRHRRLWSGNFQGWIQNRQLMEV